VYSGLTDGIEKALVADLAPQEIRGTAIGVHAMITGIGLFPASLLAGLLWAVWGPSSPFFLGGALGLAAACGIALLVRDGTSPLHPAL
jgi:MFS family permease